MDALRILKRIDAVEDEGPVRDLLLLIRQRLDELLVAGPESAGEIGCGSPAAVAWARADDARHGQYCFFHDDSNR